VAVKIGEAWDEYVPPRVHSVPDYDFTHGQDAIDLAASCGLVLDEPQRLVLNDMLGVRKSTGKFAAFECCVVEPRQNGKGAIYEARELAGVFLLGEKLLIHSAHEYATSLEAFYRMLFLLEENHELMAQVRKTRNAHGEQGFDFKNGARLRYRTRTRGGGRGFSCDFMGLDEAMQLPDFAVAALLPTLSARENPQVFFAGSAVDQEIHEHGLTLARLRERGHTGSDPSLAYFEWSLEFDHPDDVLPEMAADPRNWKRSNPALGDRISVEHVEKEQRSMPPRSFAVERLGVGDWPSTDPEALMVWTRAQWKALEDLESEMTERSPLVIAFDVTPDRATGSIGCAGLREDDLGHVELMQHRRGTGWIPGLLVDYVERYKPAVVACDGASPAASLIPLLEKAGVKVKTLTTNEYVRACGSFFDAVVEEKIRHRDDPVLNAAIWGAATRPLADRFAWARRESKVDISPLVAVTVAHGELEALVAAKPLFAWA
jgi:hypothetical protein